MPDPSPRQNAQVRTVAFLGNHLPRRCGIATFTTDLVQGLRAQHGDTRFMVLPMNDRVEGYAYGDPVRFDIDDQDQGSYRRAADFLNINNVDVVCLQHEYGIFGGRNGEYVLDLLQAIRMPLVTTFHTILDRPNEDQRRILQRIAQRSARVVSMSQRGAGFLREIYQVPDEKVAVIHHGIHDVPFVDPNFYKDQFGVEGKRVLMTFGLLSPGKGLEHMIRALPAVIARHPDVVYLVVGATHPHVKAQDGESYRLGLQRLARDLAVDDHVIFHDQFVELEELMEFIGATDIYITPYPNEAQITSGTLAYALGAGKAVVSTPYWYARELLADGRGTLVPFNDPQALAEAVNHLLEDEVERNALRKRAYALGREMTWSRVASQYMDLFRQARVEHRPTLRFRAQTLARSDLQLPEINLDQLERMTDDTGLIQHALFTTPDPRHGYSIDDNARGLILCTQLADEDRSYADTAGWLANRYLSYLVHAWNPGRRRFRNFLGYDRRWRDEVGSEDCHGRALWALGTILGRSDNEGFRQLASHLFEQALDPVPDFTSPRAWAFTILGLSAYLSRFPGDRRARALREELAARLHQLYRDHRRTNWCWYEPILSYSNARLPQALMVAAQANDDTAWLEAALESFEWLADLQHGEDGIFEPIGSDGWYPQGGVRARFDQQPVEAYTHVAACLDAWRITQDEHWRRDANRAFEWFLGVNRVGVPLYDPGTGGCRDGLHQDRANQNQGAESILSFLLARLDMGRFAQEADRPPMHRGFASVAVRREPEPAS